MLDRLRSSGWSSAEIELINQLLLSLGVDENYHDIQYLCARLAQLPPLSLHNARSSGWDCLRGAFYHVYTVYAPEGSSTNPANALIHKKPSVTRYPVIALLVIQLKENEEQSILDTLIARLVLALFVHGISLTDAGRYADALRLSVSCTGRRHSVIHEIAGRIRAKPKQDSQPLAYGHLYDAIQQGLPANWDSSDNTPAWDALLHLIKVNVDKDKLQELLKPISDSEKFVGIEASIENKITTAERKGHRLPAQENTLQIEPVYDKSSESKVDKINHRSNYWQLHFAKTTAWDVDVLNPVELGLYTQQLEPFDFSFDSEHFTGALLGGLLLCTGMRLKMLLNATLGEQGVFVLTGYFNRTFPNTRKQETQLTVSLPLPLFLTRTLRALYKDSHAGQTLAQRLNLEVQSAAQQVLQFFREAVGERVAGPVHGRLANTLAHRLYLATSDLALTYYLTGQARDMPPVVAHYAAYRQEEYRLAYLKLLGSWFSPEELNRHNTIEDKAALFLGEGDAPQIKTIQSDITNLFLHTKRAIKNYKNDIVTAHNCYTTYVVMLFSFATGARIITEPLADDLKPDIKNHWVFIEDKIVSPAHRYRPVSICSMLEKQFSFYRKHLESVWDVLREQNTPDKLLDELYIRWSYHFGQTFDIKGDEPGPFFYLSNDLKRTIEIKPSTLSERLDKEFSYPVNAGRRFLATELRRAGVPVSAIEVLLGHTLVNTANFGAASLDAPDRLLGELRAAIDALLEAEGWLPLKGIQRRGLTAMALSVNAIEHYQAHQGAVTLRELSREQRREASREAVAAILGQHDPAYFTEAENIRQCMGEIARQLEQRGLNIRDGYRYLSKQLNAYRKQGHRIRFSALIQPALNTCAFYHWTLRYHAIALELRRTILERWQQLGRVNEGAGDPARQLAEIVLSAAMFGGLMQAEHLRTLPQRLEQLSCFNRRLMIDFSIANKNDDTLRHRWWADPITSLFIIGFKNQYKEPAESITADIRHTIKESLCRVMSKRDRQQDCFKLLAKIAQAYWSLHAPALLYHVSAGDVFTQPIPQKTLCRMQTGQDLVEHQLPVVETDIARPSVNDNKRHSEDFDPGKFNQALNKIFADIEEKPAKGATHSSKTQLHTLAERITHLLSTENQVALPIGAEYLCQWALDLIQNGTRYTETIVFNTIKAYITCIKPILLSSIHINRCLHDEDDDDIRRFIYQAVDETSYHDTAWFTGRLIEFVFFLGREYGAAIPDMSGLEKILNIRCEKQVDANLVTHAEYERTLSYLLADERFIQRDRDLYAFALLLGYGFGFRISECMRLRGVDIVWVDGQLRYITQRNNLAGQGKSKAAYRHVPLLHTLSDVESSLLKRMTRMINDLKLIDGQEFIFSHIENPRLLVDKNTILSIVQSALRRVSGDNSLRFHHLRHTFANRVLLLLLMRRDDVYVSSWPKNTFGDVRAQKALLAIALNDESPARHDPLVNLAAFMGHASVNTTLFNYIHLSDMYSGHCTWQMAERISDEVMGYALNKQKDAIRQHRHNKGCAASESKQYVEHIIGKAERSLSGTLWSESIAKASVERSDVSRGELLLHQLEGILDTCRGADKSKIPSLAEEMQIDTGILRTLLDVAARLSLDSHYDHYALCQLSQSGFANAANSTPSKSHRLKNTERPRLHHYLRQLDASRSVWLDADSSRLIQLWSNSYQPRNGRLAFKDKESIQVFFSSLARFDLKPEHFHAYLPESISLQSADSHWLTKYGLQIRQGGKESVQAISEIEIALMRGAFPKIGFQKTLNRFLFVLGVYLAFKEAVTDLRDIVTLLERCPHERRI